MGGPGQAIAPQTLAYTDIPPAIRPLTTVYSDIPPAIRPPTPIAYPIMMPPTPCIHNHDATHHAYPDHDHHHPSCIIIHHASSCIMHHGIAHPQHWYPPWHASLCRGVLEGTDCLPAGCAESTSSNIIPGRSPGDGAGRSGSSDCADHPLSECSYPVGGASPRGQGTTLSLGCGWRDSAP